jgi:ribosomal-protein-alanine N-acetyltransferase
VILTTPRLILREFVAADWPAVLAYQSDPRYLRYYAWTERTESEVRDFVARFLAWQAEEPRLRFQLAVSLRDGGGLIGNCGVRLEMAGARAGELGYEIAPAHWDQGYATEAAEAMMHFGFEALGLHRIWAHTVAENVASQRVMEKLGMCGEGLLRETEWFRGRWWDTVVFGILEHEWRQRR